MKDMNRAEENDSLLKELFVEELKDVYGAEKQIMKNLPKMQKAAGSDDLKKALDNHLKVTGNQISRLEEIFQTIGQRPKANKCFGIDGLTEEFQVMMKETKEGTSTRDAAIIISAQKVEHYEIAAYGSLETLARRLGEVKAADLLKNTLEEEKDTDKTLTELAEQSVNEKASVEIK
jgi:ferritin-like metal-binding protein YciE